MTVDVVVDAPAANFVRARGGKVYLWVDAAGLVHVRMKPPGDDAAWERLVRDEVDVFVAPSAGALQPWQISLVRFPWKRLVAESEMTKSPGQDLIGTGL